jgi:uncharacterized membrane protein
MNNNRTHPRFVVTVLLSFLLCFAIRAQAGNSGFASIDYPAPGVTDTEATAITPSGVIVGRYLSADGHQHGFVLKNGTFTPVNVGSILTDAAWINASGAIVGSYVSTDGKGHAYVSSGGAVTTIDFSVLHKNL